MDLDALFEPVSPLAARLRDRGPFESDADVLPQAASVLGELDEADRIATLNAHPRLGADPATLSAHSRSEQGVDVEVELDELNRRYEERFGFRFVTFVNRRSKAEVAGELRRRLAGTRDAELTAGLDAILRIAEDRLRRSRHEIRYGKAGITVYRTYAAPLRDLPPIPESPFVGRGNELFGAQVSVDVFGDNFLGAYTEGDNSQVVATDTMKNFVHAQAVAFEGATFEGFASFLAERYLQTYPQMRRVRITMRELPYAPRSDRLLSQDRNDAAWVKLEADRGGVLALRCGRRDLRLVKLTGSSFAGFQRDAWTTLPERPDRPLFIFLDVLWRYREVADALDLARRRLVPSEQVRDLVQAVFDEFVSLSIQHLVHEMGTRLLDRFQQLAEVSFEAQNRLWDTVAETEGDPRRRVYADPRPAHGVIGLTLRR